MRLYLILAGLGTLPLLLFPLLAVSDAANYRYAFVFLVPILWGTFFARRALHLLPSHFALFALALILHNLGALGWYQREFVALPFDLYVHFYFGLVGSLILERAFRASLALQGLRMWIAVSIFFLGLATIHELVEFGSTLILGENGMWNSADAFDTPTDLLSGLLGSLMGLCASALWRRIRSARATAAAAVRRG